MVAGKSDFDTNGNFGFNLKEQIDPNLYVPLITIDGLGLDATKVAGTEIVACSENSGDIRNVESLSVNSFFSTFMVCLLN